MSPSSLSPTPSSDLTGSGSSTGAYPEVPSAPTAPYPSTPVAAPCSQPTYQYGPAAPTAAPAGVHTMMPGMWSNPGNAGYMAYGANPYQQPAHLYWQGVQPGFGPPQQQHPPGASQPQPAAVPGLAEAHLQAMLEKLLPNLLKAHSPSAASPGFNTVNTSAFNAESAAPGSEDLQQLSDRLSQLSSDLASLKLSVTDLEGRLSRDFTRQLQQQQQAECVLLQGRMQQFMEHMRGKFDELGEELAANAAAAESGVAALKDELAAALLAGEVAGTNPAGAAGTSAAAPPAAAAEQLAPAAPQPAGRPVTPADGHECFMCLEHFQFPDDLEAHLLTAHSDVLVVDDAPSTHSPALLGSQTTYLPGWLAAAAAPMQYDAGILIVRITIGTSNEEATVRVSKTCTVRQLLASVRVATHREPYLLLGPDGAVIRPDSDMDQSIDRLFSQGRLSSGEVQLTMQLPPVTKQQQPSSASICPCQ